jgi:hypothetical protein
MKMLESNTYTESPAPSRTERRGASRFPIERALRLRVLSRKGDPGPGRGHTINISSTGIFFTSDSELTPGRRVELAISWPAQLNETCALKLVARGRVIRVDGSKAAIEIQQYEFRTAGSSGFQD